MAESEPLNIVPANSAPEPEPDDPSVPKTCRLCAAENLVVSTFLANPI